MSVQLCLFICNNFRSEVEAVIAAEGWQDVYLAPFPSRCGRPEVNWQELSELKSHEQQPVQCSHNLVFGRACIASLTTPPSGFPQTTIIHLEQCFHMVAGSQLVDHEISNGSYLITPGWLVNWRQHIEEMGFTDAMAGTFFHDFAKELVLLDTGVDTQAQQNLDDFQTLTEMPARTIPVGLDHVQLMLNKKVLEWRLDCEKNKLSAKESYYRGELADHVSAMDMLTHLAKSEHEKEAIESIQELFMMLFAPAALYYMRVEHEINIPIGDIPAGIQKSMISFEGDYAWTADEQGFMLKISNGQQLLGRVAIDQLAFPEQRERYLNMALAVIGVCGLAIENSRNRKKLLEAEKMASLSIVVAGIAHEINTPLGVGVAAVSTLKRHTVQLQGDFSERKMTQSDLENYFQQSQKEMTLLASNLGRITQLVNAFRQVAVDGGQQQKGSCFLRSCLDTIIQSFEQQLESAQVSLHIECDPKLEIRSLTNDWASIFSNFIDNSLKHGFRNKTSGNIDIKLVTDSDKLKFYYDDDGKGLEKKSLAQIFDPFYSTVLQNGMGLGMHLVYNLITHRMGGSILCDSQPDKGIHCYIEVPL